jgi:hypothetical protein
MINAIYPAWPGSPQQNAAGIPPVSLQNFETFVVARINRYLHKDFPSARILAYFPKRVSRVV